MNTAQDIKRKDQLSEIIRYVSTSYDEAWRPTNLKINESFLGVIEITNEMNKEPMNRLRSCLLYTSRCV